MPVHTLLDVARLTGNDVAVGLIEENQTFAPEVLSFLSRVIPGTQYEPRSPPHSPPLASPPPTKVSRRLGRRSTSALPSASFSEARLRSTWPSRERPRALACLIWK